jgi:hypothetical protein
MYQIAVNLLIIVITLLAFFAGTLFGTIMAFWVAFVYIKKRIKSFLKDLEITKK